MDMESKKCTMTKKREMKRKLTRARKRSKRNKSKRMSPRKSLPIMILKKMMRMKR